MSVCPISLLNVTNGVFYYQCVDCDNPMSTSSASADHPLTCGCDGGNTDCFAAPGGPGIGLPHARALAPVKKKAAKNSAKKAAQAAAPGNDFHDVRPSIASYGLASALPADYRWLFSGASYNSKFDGEDAFHVATVNGQQRYIRVVHATIRPPSSLLHLSFDGKSPRLHHLPELELRIGQETDLPDGAKPRPMVVAGLTAGGPFYVKLKRSGAPADSAVFHVLLKR
jgi:hypothetical protein